MVQTLVDPYRLISPIKTIQYVGGKTVSTVGETTSYTMDLTGLSGGGSIQTDDLIVIGYAIGATADFNLSITDYTELADLYTGDNVSTAKPNLGIYYRFATSAETTASISSSGDVANGRALTIQVFRNVNMTTTFDVSSITGTATTGALVNLPAITPVTNGAYIVGIGSSSHNRGVTGTYSSSDLSGFISIACNDTNDCGIGAGYKAWTTATGTFDPAQWTFNDVNSVNYGTAYGIFALRPAGA